MCKACGHAKAHVRGLCRRCYDRARARGTLELVADAAHTSATRARSRRTRHPLGVTRLTSKGYVEVWTGDGWASEHRRIMERQIGRALLPGERIRHRNGISADNRPENLELRRSTDGIGTSAADTGFLAATFYRDATLHALAQTVHVPDLPDTDRVSIIFTRACDRTGLTRKALADALGIGPSYLSQMMRQRRPIPAATLVRVLDLSGIPLETVLPA